MLARIWWKEARTLWPIFAAVAVIASATAGLFWRYGDMAFLRDGALLPILTAISLLYAFAASSSAFAGERETKTLGFLDTLPVDRRTLWTGKTSFAYATSAALGLACLLLAAALTLLARSHYGTPPAELDPFSPLRGGSLDNPWLWPARSAVILVEAVAWGLFWSAVTENVLIVAVLAIGSVALGELALQPFYGINHVVRADSPSAWLWRLASAALALVLSRVVLTRAPRPSPAPRVRRVRDETNASSAPRMAHSPRATAFLRLIWETARQARSPSLWLLGAGVFAVVALFWNGFTPGGRDLAADLAMMASILGPWLSMTAGACVFGLPNRRHDQRFLAHHGVHPANAWLAKVATWGIPLLAIGLGLDWAVRQFVTLPGGAESQVYGSMLWLGWGGGFALGVLCGMIVPRLLTALMVGVLGMLLVVYPLMFMSTTGLMATLSALALTPFVLMVLSLAWSPDWLLERRGLRPWVKLAGVVVLLFAPIFGLYVCERAEGLPDVQWLARPTSQSEPHVSAVPEAIAAYRPAEAAMAKILTRGSLQDMSEAIDSGWEESQLAYPVYLEENRKALEFAREAAARPPLATASPASLLEDADPSVVDLGQELGGLLGLDARDRLSRGELDGSWADLRAILRMETQLGRGRGLIGYLTTLRMRDLAEKVAFDWAADPRQTPKTLRDALADLAALPTRPSLGEAVHVEAWLVDKAFSGPTDELRELAFVPFYQEPNGGPRVRMRNSQTSTGTGTLEQLDQDWLMAPWERQRARRALSMAYALAVSDASRPAWAPPDDVHSLTIQQDTVGPGRIIPLWYLTRANVAHALATTPLARRFFYSIEPYRFASDMSLVREGALRLTLAIELYRREHGGRHPATLSELVPEILPTMPVDPYSGREFGYVQSHGQTAARPGRGEGRQLSPGDEQSTRPGQWLLYSVGPDLKDDRADKDVRADLHRSYGDIVFPLPDDRPPDPVETLPAEPFQPQPPTGGPDGMGGMSLDSP